MGASLFIKLDEEVDFETFVNGKSLSKTADILNEFASQLGVKPLMEFFSEDPEALLEETEIEVTWKEEWFLAREGLLTVNALLSYIADNNVLGTDKDCVMADLKEFQQVLSKANKQDIKWHLAVDY